MLDELAFKGGTALRKLYAGNQGRFSLDLDFSVAAELLDAVGKRVAGDVPDLAAR